MIYTHFHYVAGTTAIDADAHLIGYPIWGHERIRVNRERMATEVGVTMRRGLVHQFGLTLPDRRPRRAGQRRARTLVPQPCARPVHRRLRAADAHARRRDVRPSSRGCTWR